MAMVSIVKTSKAHLETAALRTLIKWPEQQLLGIDDDGGLARTILYDGQIVGVVLVMPDGELMALVVPEYQRRGVATEAVRQILGVARKDKGFAKLVATARIGSPGSRLVAKVGAVEVRRTTEEISYEIPLPIEAGGVS